VARAVLLRTGRGLRWVPPTGPVGELVPLDPDPIRAAEEFDRSPRRLSDELRARTAAARPAGPAAAVGPDLAESFDLPLAPEDEARRARARAFPSFRPADRAFYLALARRRIAERLRDPSEVLLSLAREEERFERAHRREAEALAHFLAPPEGTLERYRASWQAFSDEVDRQHARLTDELERTAHALVPHLSAIVGPRVAARLVARAGGLPQLARASAPRLQLLGARRRPGPGRSPRFGVLYRAARMEDVPADRQGAYARSLAALAAIAARLDAYGRGQDRREELLSRRDRIVARLGAAKR
jgi:hypothetical protein